LKSYWDMYKGKKFFYARYDKLSIEQIRTEIADVEKIIVAQPLDSVLLLIDTAGTIISPEALNLLKNIAVKGKKFTRKTAVLGVTGARRTMLEIVVKFSGLPVSSFETEQQAKDWLVQS
jgi:hypothetical protein